MREHKLWSGVNWYRALQQRGIKQGLCILPWIEGFLTYSTFKSRGVWWHSCLRHCTTGWKVAGSIPDGVTAIFHWHNPSGHNIALGLTQLLTEKSTRNISLGIKAVSVYGWQTCHLHAQNVMKSGSLKLVEHSGSVQACTGVALPSSSTFKFIHDRI